MDSKIDADDDRQSETTVADFKRQPDHLFSADAVISAGIVGSRSSVRRAIQTGKIPTPVRLPSNRLAWRGKVLADWYDALERSACAA